MNSNDYGMALTMKKKRKIKLLIVEDDRSLAGTLKELITIKAKDITVVGITINTASCLQAVNDQHPDVILLDQNLKDGDTGIDILLELKKSDSQPKVIMFTMFPGDTNFFTGIKLNIDGFIEKSGPVAMDSDNIINAIRMVASGKKYFSDSDLSRIQAEFGEIDSNYFSKRITDQIETPKKKHITQRECDVILAMIKLGNRQLAAKSLGISPGTVKNHISSINDKLGTKTIEQAAIVANKIGIIHLY